MTSDDERPSVKRLATAFALVSALVLGLGAVALSAPPLQAPTLSVVSTTVQPSGYGPRYDRVTTTLQWTSVPGAATYSLCYSRPSLKLGCELGIKKTTYTLTQSILKGATYRIWVRACPAGTSPSAQAQGDACATSNTVSATAP